MNDVLPFFVSLSRKQYHVTLSSHDAQLSRLSTSQNYFKKLENTRCSNPMHFLRRQFFFLEELLSLFSHMEVLSQHHVPKLLRIWII